MEIVTNILKIEGGNANKEKINELLKQSQENKIDFNTLVQEVRKLGGKVTFGEFQVESENKEKVTELLEQFNTGKLGIEVFIQKVRDQGDKAVFWNWETGANPRYIGNNKSAVGFRYNPFHSIKGMFMQSIIKTAIRQALSFVFSIRSLKDLVRNYQVIKAIILFAHFNLTRHYDPNAYKYDDERLQKLEKELKQNISRNFQENIYKTDVMFKGMDILFFILKEDIYWRARIFRLINEVVGVEVFKLTEEEKENIKRWH